jgi:hypothetical protein
VIRLLRRLFTDYPNCYIGDYNGQDDNRCPDIPLLYNFFGPNSSGYYGVRLTLYFEGSTDVNGCDKWAFYIFGLSPRERTGVASPILEAESPIIRAVFAFDMQFRGSWASTAASQFDALVEPAFEYSIKGIS